MTGHYCAEHETVFFKKGSMRGYAHPIGTTGKWCNEPDEIERVIKTPVDLPPPEAILEPPKPPKDELTRSQEIERAVWFKELGECLRSGFIDVTKPQGLQLKMAYLAEMFRVLNIKPTKTEPKP